MTHYRLVRPSLAERVAINFVDVLAPGFVWNNPATYTIATHAGNVPGLAPPPDGTLKRV